MIARAATSGSRYAATAEESGRRREESCQLRSPIVADNRRSVWETALPWEVETM